MSRKRQRRWTDEEIRYLREHYADTPNPVIAKALGRTSVSIKQQATKHKLEKSQAFMSSSASGRRQKGQAPWNKGLAGVCGNHPNTKRNHFKKGHGGTRTRPVGSTRINKEGFVEVKTGDEFDFPVRQWEPYHRIVWMRANGPVPDGYVVAFRPGTHTTEPAEITIDSLEMISRAELMERNTIHRYPAAVRRAMIQIGLMRNELNERHQ